MNLVITDITIGYPVREGEMYAIQFHHDGARYHFWWDFLRGRVDDGKLYKNPLHDVPYGDPAYFLTRQLAPEAKANAAMIKLALTYVAEHKLVEKAEAAAKAAEVDRQNEMRRETFRAQLAELAPELRVRLRDLVKDVDNTTSAQLDAIDLLERIAKLEPTS